MNQSVGTKTREPFLGMGKVTVVAAPSEAKAVLGSCIGLILYHEKHRTGAMAHVVLAKAEGRDGPPGKFADKVVPHLLNLLAEQGVPAKGLSAKLTGGSNMFSNTGPIQVGRDNADAVRAELQKQRIPVVAEHLGGNKGRKVTFDTNSGVVTIEIAGESTVRI